MGDYPLIILQYQSISFLTPVSLSKSSRPISCTWRQFNVPWATFTNKTWTTIKPAYRDRHARSITTHPLRSTMDKSPVFSVFQPVPLLQAKLFLNAWAKTCDITLAPHNPHVWATKPKSLRISTLTQALPPWPGPVTHVSAVHTYSA